ncbi:hypothetical protein CPB86DRAFT_43327 [Serendipita vermifera]|nr:hypothetical protein CPB86DRAFT_43327 [Serendipita vermifera]
MESPSTVGPRYNCSEIPNLPVCRSVTTTLKYKERDSDKQSVNENRVFISTFVGLMSFWVTIALSLVYTLIASPERSVWTTK